MSEAEKVLHSIRERRSIGRVKSDPVPTPLIEQLLEAANWAPSHKATEPWRFVVMTGEGRAVLGEAYADIALGGAAGDAGGMAATETSNPFAVNGSSAESETGEALAAERRKHVMKAYRAPVVIAVYVSPSDAPGIVRAEEFAATHCAAQNLLLMAHSLGLGAIWRSGEPMYHPRMKQAFGLAAQEEMVGLIYVGYPDEAAPLPTGKRRPVSEKTRWVE